LLKTVAIGRRRPVIALSFAAFDLALDLIALLDPFVMVDYPVST